MIKSPIIRTARYIYAWCLFKGVLRFWNWCLLGVLVTPLKGTKSHKKHSSLKQPKTLIYATKYLDINFNYIYIRVLKSVFKNIILGSHGHPL